MNADLCKERGQHQDRSFGKIPFSSAKHPRTCSDCGAQFYYESRQVTVGEAKAPPPAASQEAA